ncbi:MAG: hypothetical protein CMA88_02980 [Euryarchaeota archaeon]|nr:hypothetical protein [Euryarchaeota archaeon]
MTADPLLSTIRISTLVLCMAIAARSDFETLSVRDSHWIKWVIPAAILLLVEVNSNNSGIANICMAFALVAVFSICFVRPPDPRKLEGWGTMEVILSTIYVLGFSGLILGISDYSDTNFVDLVLGDESPEVTLWWSMIGALLTMAVFLSAWRFRIIQGGADVKALILVTLMFPSWSLLPDQMYHLGDEAIFRLPPSMALFMWAGAAFLLAPPVIFIQNATNGNIESTSDLKMAWHATRKRISDLDEEPSWILTEVVEKEGKPIVVNRILPSGKTSSDDAAELGKLEDIGLDSVWVARKHPFLVYLFLAIAPLVLLGDPIALLIR